MVKKHWHVDINQFNLINYFRNMITAIKWSLILLKYSDLILWNLMWESKVSFFDNLFYHYNIFTCFGLLFNVG